MESAGEGSLHLLSTENRNRGDSVSRGEMRAFFPIRAGSVPSRASKSRPSRAEGNRWVKGCLCLRCGDLIFDSGAEQVDEFA